VGEETDEAATHWWVYRSMSTTVHPPLDKPIAFDVDLEARTARVSIPGVLESVGRPILGAGGTEHRVRIEIPNGVEFDRAEIGSATTTSVGAIWLSLENTLIYAVIVIPFAIVGGLVLAALLNRPIHLRGVYRASLIVPTVTPTVAAAIIWIYLLEGNGGVFNSVLGYFGIAPILWLGNPHLVIPMLAMIEAWRGIGFYTIIFLAGMQSIPRSLYQAAAIDGITGVRAFWHITVPLLRPVILFATVIATIFNLQLFDSPYVLTRGGPGFASTTLVMYIYNEAFSYDNMGYAAAIAMMLMLLILVLAVIQLTLFRKDVEF